MLNLYNKGFKFYTYTTENYIVEQIEGIIGIDDGKNYKGKVEELSIKEINGSYLGFFASKIVEKINMQLQNIKSVLI